MALQVQRDIQHTGLVTLNHVVVTDMQTQQLNGVQLPKKGGDPSTVLTMTTNKTAKWTSVPIPPLLQYDRVLVEASEKTIVPPGKVVMNARSGGTVITLPSVKTAGDQYYVVADVSGEINASRPVLIRPTPPDTIMGRDRFALVRPYNSVTLVHDARSVWILL